MRSYYKSFHIDTMHRSRVTKQRRLASFGIFSPRHWPFFRPHRSIDRRVYVALKAAGFRETIWQFVFRGQLGGLIYPVQGGKMEVHVRFYKNTIEAELEVGRHYPSHFLRPRYQAESIVLKMIHPHLSQQDYEHVRRLFRYDPADGALENYKGRVGPTYSRLTTILLPIALLLAINGALSIPVALLVSLVVIAVLTTLPSVRPPI